MLPNDLFVCQLSSKTQDEIKKRLKVWAIKEGLTKEEYTDTIQNTMEDRIWVAQMAINVDDILNDSIEINRFKK